MRQNVFIFILIALVVGLISYFIWMVLRAFYTVFDDARTGRQLDELSNEYEARRQQRKVEAVERLNNGCEHDYENLLGALPKDVCNKCGLAKVRPAGECDHCWRRMPGAIPGSECEKCGAKYGAATRV